MILINLRNLYPQATEDAIIQVPKDVIDAIKECDRNEINTFNQTIRYNAYYSLDIEDREVEKSALKTPPTPEDIYEEKRSIEKLYAALNALPEKQSKRIYGHYFLDLSKREIAKSEGVDESTVRESIKMGLENLKKILENP